MTKAQVGLGNVGNFKAVSTAASQDLTDTEKSNARANIGLGSLATKSSLAASDIPTITKSKISDFPSSMPASDVSAWAKAANKPRYTLDEVSDGTNKKWGDKIGKTIETTYANLKSLRDNSQLVPGQWYRITDYATTTTQANTQSAGHAFDIIVRADDVNVLNENAYAAKHAGDTYFTDAGAKLEAWRLLYCLDNIEWSLRIMGEYIVTQGKICEFVGTETINGTDYYKWKADAPLYGMYDYACTKTKNVGDTAYCLSSDGSVFNMYLTIESYSEASSEEGCGTIMWMKDEYDNECPYDFKNIQFKVGAKEQAGTVADVFYYTFSVATGTNDATVTDHSLNGGYCYGNKIGKYIITESQKLNANVFRSTSVNDACYSNKFGNHCYSNTFGSSCYSNTFGNHCRSNTFSSSCRANIFGNDCYSNTFGSDSRNITFGNECYSNTLGINCSNTTFGNECKNNTLEYDCRHNTFGNQCSYNTFGMTCSSNVFGNNCGSNTFGDSCSSNTFGNQCSYNTFGDSCGKNTFGNVFSSNAFGNYSYYNTFGNDCSDTTFGDRCAYNTFGNFCKYIKFGSSSSTKNYCRYIIVENGNMYLYLDCSATTSSPTQFQNVKIAQGVNNTSTYKTITHATAGDTFQTVYKPTNSVEVSV